jgi:hypothetical protein
MLGEIPEMPMARDYMDADGLEGVPLDYSSAKPLNTKSSWGMSYNASDTFNFGT